ncbi:MAG: family 20 glycosylhydrolase [Tannerellaceae bacterium]|jgi:hypothetical protein|nr:family 20 glycosylhydrolase [Tannerellaceae bacterium]
MRRLFISSLCFCFLQVSLGQQQFSLTPEQEQLRQEQRKLPVSQFASPNWPGQLIPTDSSMIKKIDDVLPVRGLAIGGPSRNGVDLFCKFIEEDLAPAHFNLLIIRVDWNYAFESYPQLRDPNPLTKEDVKKIVAVCKKHNIQIAPQINLLGHQSWAGTTYALLREFPQFDEVPHIKTENYSDYTNVSGRPQPYSDALYCKSYCPLHPDVHDVVFAVVDELMDAFEAHWFHAGMDEVFHLGDERCPRCAGIAKFVLFSDEVNRIQDHLAKSNRRLMIWGDRLIDGSRLATGLGSWEASLNNTSAAIGMINKDVFICDWHYDYSGLTAVQFAFNGLDVASSPWNNTAIAEQHLNDMLDWRTRNLQRAVTDHFQGIVHTVWSGVDGFLRTYYNPATYNVQSAATKEEQVAQNRRGGDARTLKFLISKFMELNQ